MAHLTVADRGGALWIRLKGELDQSAVLDLKPRFDAAVASAPADIVVDLGGVTFLGSLGIGLIATTQDRLNDVGRTLKLANVSDFVDRALRAVLLDRAFERVGTTPVTPIWVEDRDDARWISLAGELDQSDVLHMKLAFDEATRGARGDVVVDLGEVTFIGTLGIGLIVSAREELEDRGLTLKLSRVPAFVEKTFKVMSLTEVFARV